MKKYFFLILCCISTITIFGSESSEEDRRINEKQDRETRKYIDHWNSIDYEKKESERKAKEQAYREKNIEMLQLQKKYQEQIDLYETKITAMQLKIEELQKSHK